ncbi:type II secretion system F family protein [Pseudohalocynthiibacter aestuariivivens]|jgi:tight adherence protein C|uniref:Type II secretion system F family protein n=1 Tax=Pseudohalocynthiibacter aestuariivivens TaxID=1591409 RepID=A0ABV5JAR6_9RHOB|nr:MULTISPECIES: type II secretion system F family protein [Pseudohalocynthiibacter]MBS9715899.1 type II secretion system F family protein [Pseudohalocynthiibacter aestuariivivens]MCK0101512.1 type II secretion system F family protein [Pseudohalocynthiibacter sp. F2068]
MEIISQINELLTNQFGEFGPLLVVGILGLFLVLLTLPVMLRKNEDPLDKLRKSQIEEKKPKGNAQKLRYDTKKDKLEKYSTFLEPQNEEEYSAVRLKLLQAGYRSKQAVRTYNFMQLALGLGFLVIGAIFAIFQASTGDPSAQTIAMSIILPGVVGYMLPKYWVNRRVQSRQEEITNGFPDALDMMLVCVEAGQSLDQSIIRVSKEIRAGFPSLADEFEIVSNEVKAGKDKVSVLKDMSARAGVTDVASFVTVLVQSASFGTSIADALRVYASEMRDKRVMRAEEKANTLPTKMTLATMMLTVPPLLIILIGPSVYQISVTLSNTNF